MPIGENIEKVAPPIFDVKSPLDVSKLNPVGSDVPAIQKAQQDAFDAQEKLAKSLEDRYANPNWFNVAAGFLKPQLGGFGASLGSAAEALGQHTEAQRAVAPTVERMRAEIAAGKLGLTQRTEQSRMIDEYDAAGKPDISKLRKIYSLDPNSPVGKSIEKRPEFEQARREETGFGMGIQEKLQKNPSLIVNDPAYRGHAVSEEERKRYEASVNSARPLGITPEMWAAMGFAARQDAIGRAANEQNRYGMEEGQKAAVDAEQSHNVLDDLTVLRKLATDPSLKPIFSLGRNGDLFSQFRAFLDKNPGNTQAAVDGLVEAAMDKLKNADEATRAKADKLVKDIAKLEVRLRGTLTNPTDAASFLNQAQSPSLANSQAGFVGILDQLGLDAYRQIELNNLRRQKGLTKSDLLSTDDMRQFRNQTREMRESLASKSALDQTPSWFYPGGKQPAAAPAAAAAPASGGAKFQLPPGFERDPSDPTGRRIRRIPQ